MERGASIYVAGHKGLVGGAIVRRLERAGHDNLLLRSRRELDLTNQQAVRAFFDRHKPAYVFDAAARVGGIHANATYPADFIRDNLLIQTNLIDAAFEHGARKLLFLGSSCIYPRLAPQPMPEDCLLTGPLESTNEWYAIAKIAGIKMCQAYRSQHGFSAISLMPTNLYGPGDNFHPENSHVLPALIRRFDEAKRRSDSRVVVWGTGAPRREFLHVDDLADAAVTLMDIYDEPDIINVGVGEDIAIRDLAHLVARTIGFEGDIVFDTSKPDGTPRKLLDVSRIRALGWRPAISLEDGIRQTWEWYTANEHRLRTA